MTIKELLGDKFPEEMEILDEESKPWNENKIRIGYNRARDEIGNLEVPERKPAEPCKCDPPGSGEEYCKGDCYKPNEYKELKPYPEMPSGKWEKVEEKELMPCPYKATHYLKEKYSPNKKIIDKVFKHSNLPILHEYQDGGWWVYCSCCYARGPKHPDKEDAITAWNTRTAPEQQRLDEKELTKFFERTELSLPVLRTKLHCVVMAREVCEKLGHSVVSVPSVEELDSFIEKYQSTINLKTMEWKAYKAHRRNLAIAIKTYIDGRRV